MTRFDSCGTYQVSERTVAVFFSVRERSRFWTCRLVDPSTSHSRRIRFHRRFEDSRPCWPSRSGRGILFNWLLWNFLGPPRRISRFRRKFGYSSLFARSNYVSSVLRVWTISRLCQLISKRWYKSSIVTLLQNFKSIHLDVCIGNESINRTEVDRFKRHLR